MRAKIEREVKNLFKKEEEFGVCRKCKGDIVVDRGSSYCSNCGYDVPELMIRDQPEAKRYSRQPYRPEVHFQQAINSAMGRDPRVPIDDVREIERYLLNNPEIMGNCPFLVGWQAIKKATRELNLNSTYASRWVQIRSRFVLEGIKEDVAQFDKETLSRMKLRYRCVVKAFEENIKFKEGKASKKAGMMRRNMINLAYVIPQIVRLESEQLFRDNARYFPLTTSENQPTLNNDRWEKIITYCKVKFKKVYCEKEDEIINFTWEFIPLKTKDIFDYFLIYR